MVTAERIATVVSETAVPGIGKNDVGVLVVAYPLSAALGARQLARLATQPTTATRRPANRRYLRITLRLGRSSCPRLPASCHGWTLVATAVSGHSSVVSSGTVRSARLTGGRTSGITITERARARNTVVSGRVSKMSK